MTEDGRARHKRTEVQRGSTAPFMKLREPFLELHPPLMERFHMRTERPYRAVSLHQRVTELHCPPMERQRRRTERHHDRMEHFRRARASSDSAVTPMQGWWAARARA